MSRIMAVDERAPGTIRRLLFWQVRRQYGVVPGIFRLVMPIFRVGFMIGQLYEFLHLRKRSPFTRLQREMLATLVNGKIGGAP